MAAREVSAPPSFPTLNQMMEIPWPRRLAAKPRLSALLRARLRLAGQMRKLALAELKAALDRWDNEGGAQDTPRLRNEAGALVD